jgi:hypothetical protein
MAGAALGSSLRASLKDLRATYKLHGIAVAGNPAKRSWWEPSGGARLFSPRSEALDSIRRMHCCARQSLSTCSQFGKPFILLILVEAVEQRYLSSCNFRVFELSEVRTSPPPERYRPSNRLTAGHRLRTPDCCAFVGAFDCLTGRQAGINTHERQLPPAAVSAIVARRSDVAEQRKRGGATPGFPV